MEKVTLDIPEKYTGDVTSLFQVRKGILTNYEPMESSRTIDGALRVRLEFNIPTRGLLGITSQFLTLTRGEGLMSSEYAGYAPFKGELPHRINGTLVSDREGTALEYSLLALEPRGILFVEPGVKVYEGMIVGECSRPDDLDVNPCKERKLTNVRSTIKDAFESLKGIRQMPLERCIEWIDDDEWIEVTPQHVRLRKKILGKTLRHMNRNRPT
jgi:GTP-binding protein